MELKKETYYRITLINTKEYIVETEIKEVKNILKRMTVEGFCPLQLKGHNIFYVNTQHVMAVQQISHEMVGQQTKVWRISK